MKKLFIFFLILGINSSCLGADDNVWPAQQKKEIKSFVVEVAEFIAQSHCDNEHIVYMIPERGTYSILNKEINAVIQVFESYGFTLIDYKYQRVLIFKKKQNDSKRSS